MSISFTLPVINTNIKNYREELFKDRILRSYGSKMTLNKQSKTEVSSMYKTGKRFSLCMLIVCTNDIRFSLAS